MHEGALCVVNLLVLTSIASVLVTVMSPIGFEAVYTRNPGSVVKSSTTKNDSIKSGGGGDAGEKWPYKLRLRMASYWCDAPELNFDFKKIYYGDVRRGSISDLLRKDGEFLLRRSGGGRVLSVCQVIKTERKTRHYIFGDYDRAYSMDEKTFKSADLIDSTPIDEMAALLAMQVDSSGRKEEESVARVRAVSVGQSFRSGAEARRITDVERISPTLISQVESIESIAPIPAPIEKMAAASRLPLRMDLSGSKDESIIRARAETVGQVFRQGRDARHIERIITPISKIESVDIGGSTPSEKKQEIIGPEAKPEVVQPETSEEESDAFEIDVSGTLDISIDLAGVGQIQQADISINTEIEADLVSEMEEVSVAGNVNCVMTGIEDPASERGYDKTVPSIASSPVSMSFNPRSRTRSESPAISRRRPSSSPPASISNANIIKNPVSNRRSSSVPPEQGASGGGRAVINSPTSHRGQSSTSPATSSGRIFDTMRPSSSKSVPIESNTPTFKGWEPPRGPGMRDFIGKMMSPTRSVPVEVIDVKAPSPLPEFVYVNSFGEIIVAAEEGKQKPTRSSQGTSSEKN